MTEEEITGTQKAILGLDAVLNLPDKNIIHAKIENLYELSGPYAERLMNKAIVVAITGKKV